MKIIRIILIFLFTLSLYADKKSLSMAEIDNLLKSNRDLAISFGNGKQKLDVFIDPKCPYSRAFITKYFSTKKMQDEFSLYLYLYELKKLDSKEYIKLILSSDKKEYLLKKVMLEDYKFSESDFKNFKNLNDEETKKRKRKRSLKKRMNINDNGLFF